jgi:hypothetical protein
MLSAIIRADGLHRGDFSVTEYGQIPNQVQSRIWNEKR